jgi:integrase
MAQKEITKNGVKKLIIYTSINCSEYPGGKIQRKKVVQGVAKDSARANAIERELIRETERESAKREAAGTNWESLVGMYELWARDEESHGRWVQSKQTLFEAVRSLHNWTNDWYKEPASNITASDVTKLFHKMKAGGASDSTIGKLRADIRKVFEFGLLFDHVRGIRHNPTTGVTIKSRKRMRTEILCEDEIKKLLSYAKSYEPAWHPIYAFAVYTGCRNGELYALKWSDIDFQERLITVQRSYNKRFNEEKCTKTGEWRRVSICEPLWDIVLELKRIHDHDVERGACRNPGYVLPRPGVWQNGEQAKKLREFCQEIGITPICFHTLRACFATELLRRGVDIPSVMRVGGWKSLKSMMHYVRISGVADKGITDPLDYRSEDPTLTNRKLLNAVGDSFRNDNGRSAEIIPLPTRKLPMR